MARIRTIKPTFFTSETISRLTVHQRLTFIGLWTHVDDDGRCVDNPRLIRAALWPLDERTDADLDDDLGALSECSLITRYTVGGKRYLSVTGWREHQVINRRTKSKYPAPEEGEATPTRESTEHSYIVQPPLMEDSVSAHGAITEDSRQEGKGREGKGKNTSRSRASSRPSSSPPGFNEFWLAYPRKDGKKEALDSYAKALTRDGVTPELLLAGARGYADRMRRDGTERAKIKMAQGWLNNDRWTDEPDQPATPERSRKFAWQN